MELEELEARAQESAFSPTSHSVLAHRTLSTIGLSEWDSYTRTKSAFPAAQNCWSPVLFRFVVEIPCRGVGEGVRLLIFLTLLHGVMVASCEMPLNFIYVSFPPSPHTHTRTHAHCFLILIPQTHSNHSEIFNEYSLFLNIYSKKYICVWARVFKLHTCCCVVRIILFLTLSFCPIFYWDLFMLSSVHRVCPL